MSFGLFMLKRTSFADNTTAHLVRLQAAILDDMRILRVKHAPILARYEVGEALDTQKEKRIAKEWQDFMFYLGEIEKELNKRRADFR